MENNDEEFYWKRARKSPYIYNKVYRFPSRVLSRTQRKKLRKLAMGEDSETKVPPQKPIPTLQNRTPAFPAQTVYNQTSVSIRGTPYLEREHQQEAMVRQTDTQMSKSCGGWKPVGVNVGPRSTVIDQGPRLNQQVPKTKSDNINTMPRKRRSKTAAALFQQPASTSGPINVAVSPPPRKNNIEIPLYKHTSGAFVAPEQQQETMMDLTDDMSPDTPMPISRGGWRPVGGNIGTPNRDIGQGHSSNQQAPTDRHQQWIKFQENLHDKLEKKTQILETNQSLKWVNLNKSNEQTSSTMDRTSESRQQNQGTPNTGKGNIVLKGQPSINMFASDTNRTLISVNTIETEAKHRNVAGKTVSPTQEVDPSSDSPQPYKASSSLEAEDDDDVGGKHLQHNPMAMQFVFNKGFYGKGVPRTFMANNPSGMYGAIQPFDAIPAAIPKDIQSRSESTSPVFDAYVSKPNTAMFVQTSNLESSQENLQPQQYSPSDSYYTDSVNQEQENMFSESEETDSLDAAPGQKRVSAFQRLGPMSQPRSAKQPKLTINLMCNKDQSVREVVDETKKEEMEDQKKVYLRNYILESRDEMVVKFLPFWPWKKNVSIRKTVTNRPSKSVMIMEQEQMEEFYDKENLFFQVALKGYPQHWTKENVLDALLESLRGKTFIPCFVEFNAEECKFLVIKNRIALVAIHKMGFFIRKDDEELAVSISSVDLSLNQIDFIPRLVLRKRLAKEYDGERKLSLKRFTLEQDISHFIYFPLNRVTNQMELIQIQSTIAWNYLTDLDLSYNRLSTIEGFELPSVTPRLKNLDLSHNYLDRMTTLLSCRGLGLHSLVLEGNPLCHDYTDPAQYVKVVRLLFPSVTEIDGLPIHYKGDMPKFKKNYCPQDALDVAGKFLEVFFPLLDSPVEDRMRIEELYDEKAVMTVTYRYLLHHSPLYRYFRNLFLRARSMEDGEMEAVEGAPAIIKLVCKWPPTQHDPATFTTDVMHHSEYSTILRISGIVKLTAESLAEDEHLLAFTRTIVLMTRNGSEYKIHNEMVYWDEPTKECASTAFKINTIRSRRFSLKLESPPDSNLQEKLTEIFMKLTDLDKNSSEKCLETKEWNIKAALEYFIKLVKLDSLGTLTATSD